MTTTDADNARLIAWARKNRAGRIPGHAITRDEYDALMECRDRPLTADPVTRHHKGDQHTEIGEML